MASNGALKRNALIRFARSLGRPLKEIGEIARGLAGEGLSAEREMAIIDTQVERRERKAGDLARLLDYLRAKRDWIARGKPGDEPRFTEEGICLAEIAPPANQH